MGAKWYGLLAVLIIKRLKILAILVPNRSWFLNSSLEFGMFGIFLEEVTFLWPSLRPSTNVNHNACELGM